MEKYSSSCDLTNIEYVDLNFIAETFLVRSLILAVKGLMSQNSLWFVLIYFHCVTTEKVPAKYRSLKMAEASLGKWYIFNDCGGIASTRHWISVHSGKKSAWERFRILVQSREALERLYEALEGPV